eukprot:4509894-Alexandrium_andersonii.AAC.1
MAFQDSDREIDWQAVLCNDSSTARSLATRSGASRKMKHIEARYLFTQDLVKRKELTLRRINT